MWPTEDLSAPQRPNLPCVAMRSDCKHYESRTYGANETVRKCKLDLAPEAPWHCPADCSSFALRMVDVGWTYGSLADAMAPAPSVPEVAPDADIAALLDSAEDIVNAAGAEILAEMAKREQKAANKGKRKRFRKN
jgi:hypothetical protein